MLKVEGYMSDELSLLNKGKAIETSHVKVMDVGYLNCNVHKCSSSVTRKQ